MSIKRIAVETLLPDPLAIHVRISGCPVFKGGTVIVLLVLTSLDPTTLSFPLVVLPASAHKISTGGLVLVTRQVKVWLLVPEISTSPLKTTPVLPSMMSTDCGGTAEK